MPRTPAHSGKFSLEMAPESGRAAHPAEENVLKRTKTGRGEKEGKRMKGYRLRTERRYPKTWNNLQGNKNR